MTSAPPESTHNPISERSARTLLAVERYALPWVSFVLAWAQLRPVIAGYTHHQIVIHAGSQEASWPLFWAGMTRNVLLCCLSTFMGLILFVNRRPAHLPKDLAHIMVPLAMSYYFLLYPAVDFLPAPLRDSLLPAAWRVPAAAAAVLVAILGYSVTLWGLFSLRRSFALFVAVRNVVSAGPYAYVRHPMYLGYILELVGLILASFSPGMLILGAGFLLITFSRAHLEEARLVEATPGYREYMNRTGFLFPRFSRRTAPIVPS
jgi:protein-S-isoprenylcysteine O-methyltransferase Ste14